MKAWLDLDTNIITNILMYIFRYNAQIICLSEKLQSVFNFSDDVEYSIEVDPRGIDEDTIKALARTRFNSINLGVQGFNVDVQKAVNRIQSFEQTKEVMGLSPQVLS